MTMLAEVVDAVIGIDTYRDSREVEIADAAGRPIAVMRALHTVTACEFRC